MYFPSPKQVFYRVGFYDNIFKTDRLSIIEIGYPGDAVIDEVETERMLQRSSSLKTTGLIDEHCWSRATPLSWIRPMSTSPRIQTQMWRPKTMLAHRGVPGNGRYGSWTYYSIEDNIVEARALASSFNALLTLE